MALVPLEQLLEWYPVKVAYPGGGIHYLLEWYTHGEQWHTILGRTPRQVDLMFLEAMQKPHDYNARDHFELGQYLKVEIVAPPVDYLPIYALQRWQAEVRDFWRTIVCECYSADENGEYAYRPPPGIIFCPNHAPTDPDCEDCMMGMRPVEGTLESVYLARRDTYRALHHRKPYVDPHPRFKMGPSRARVSGPEEKVQVLTHSPGHHQQGTRILNDQDRENWPWGACFYLIELEKADRSEMDSILEMDAQDRRDRQEKHDAMIRARMARERKEREERLGKLFP